jgi:hypothetical protein
MARFSENHADMFSLHNANGPALVTASLSLRWRIAGRVRGQETELHIQHPCPFFPWPEFS